jgi:IclR family transcriptional regulator, blcABC operon repressor
MASEAAEGRRSSSPAIDKATAVLECLAASDEPLSFAELSARVLIPRSSLHDVCTTLVANGLVERQGVRYRLGIKVVEFARRRLAGMDVVQVFRSLVTDLDLDDTIVLSVRSGQEVTYVSFVQSGKPLAVHYEIGLRLPAAFTASGKAILASMTDDEVQRLFGARRSRIGNPNVDSKDKDVPTLLEELGATRERGYSIDDEETAVGMVCLGAPIFGGDSENAIAAVALSMVIGAATSPPTKQAQFIMKVARDITVQLAGSTVWFDRLPDGPRSEWLEPHALGA